MPAAQRLYREGLQVQQGRALWYSAGRQDQRRGSTGLEGELLSKAQTREKGHYFRWRTCRKKAREGKRISWRVRKNTHSAEARASIKKPLMMELEGGRRWSLKTLKTIKVPEERDALAKVIF